MAFVFWDTETTGISTSFDQILQFAAVYTDAELNEIDRIELRCRLHPHVVPSPRALKVTGMTLAKITDRSLPCHYEMIRTLRAKLIKWSPAIFIGYNSYRFDEELLRKALFRTLHSPYLTNSKGNGRADALLLVQAASVLEPGCLEIPMGDKGQPVFKLDRLAPLNGFDHSNAHDAMADVLATVHVARCVSARAPHIFGRFLRFAMKPSVASFLDEEDVVLMTEFYFNRAYHFVVTPFATDPDNPAKVLALDLRHDPDWLATLAPDELETVISQSPKPIRGIKTNAPPSLVPLDEVDPTFFGALTEDLARSRAARLKGDDELKARLLNAYAAVAEAYEDSEHVEEQLYSGGFVPAVDEALTERFHLASWPDRARIAHEFTDARLRYHALRLVYEDHPELLSPEARTEIQGLIWERLLMEDCPKDKWSSLHLALAETEGMLAEGVPSAEAMLLELRAHLQTRIAEGQARSPA